ncbi:MAG: peptidylprolyl isomerase [Acidimicrobiales bacterium]|nr:peptidylprolyl isomerase [Acidimicrobiales bacterium]
MHATLHTNRGDIRLELFPDQAPKTVANFTSLAKGEPTWRDQELGRDRTAPFYDGIIFHRVIAGFMIQGGCPKGIGNGGPGYDFEDEFAPGLTFDHPYVLAMANAGPGTNGSQFFVTVAPTPHLQNRHTIFGEVADDASKAVVDAIATTPTGRGDRPVEDVVIERVTVEDD